MYVKTNERFGPSPISPGSLRPHIQRALGEPRARTAPRLSSQVRPSGSNSLCVQMPAPPLLGAKDNTLYVEIPLGIDEAINKQKQKFKLPPVSGIFVPPSYRVGYLLNMIVYFHGHTADFPGDGASIEKYWDASQFPFFALREAVRDSGKNVILVAPTLGPLCQSGALTLWPDAYLDQVVLALRAHGGSKRWSVPQIWGNIILACHSGGGALMRQIALRKNRYTNNILECWGFDCLYGDAPETNQWAGWAKSNQDKNLYVYYCDSRGKRDPRKNCSSTKSNSENLKRKAAADGLKNIQVERSTASEDVRVEKSTANAHFWVPLAHLKERIQKTTFPERP